MLNSFYGLGLAIFQMIISRKVQKNNILNYNYLLRLHME